MTEILSEPNSLESLPTLIAARRYLWEQELARPNQLPNDDEDWNTYLALAGRGFGKTRMAAEWLAWQAILERNSRWAIVAPTFADSRDTAAEGVSGIVNILREYGVLKDYNRSMGEIVLTNRSKIKLFSGEEPDRLRGPQFHGGWFDELASFKYPDAWDQYQFALRLGDRPRTIVTTTPRPTKIIRDLSSRPGVKVVRGSTFDNAANLAESALAEMRLRYEGTNLGRQELYGEIVDNTEGALWSREMIEKGRITAEEQPALIRIVVAIDPAVTSGENSDSTGITVTGVTADAHYYLLADLTMKGSPDTWARKAVDAYHKYGADRIIGETNNGGDMIELLLRQVDPSVSFRKVTATRGKLVRAEPVASLYEQSRVHHVGMFEELEDQLTSYTPDSNNSPDRMDSLVWGITDLMASTSTMMGLAALAKFCPTCRLPASRTATTCPSCGGALGN
jgi:phage terminase large subunit-like protein